MTDLEFGIAIGPLESMFEKLQAQKVSQYYEIFRNYPLHSLKDAVRWLIRNHTYRRFPLPAEIVDAIREIDKDRSMADADDLDALRPACEICAGTGWELVTRHEPLYDLEVYHRSSRMEKEKETICGKPEDHQVAIFCRCQKGKAMKSEHERQARMRLGAEV